MDFVGFLLTQCLNAFSQAAVLFFIACGLTLIFGIMRIINFAHGSLFMLGAYVGYSTVAATGSFWLALIVAPIVVGAVGMAFEKVFLSRLYARGDGGAYLMVTFGLAVIMGEMITAHLGPAPARRRHARYSARRRLPARPAVPEIPPVPDRSSASCRARRLAVP